MDAIKLSVWVGEDKKLVIDLPEDVPVGQADIVITPREEAKSAYSPTYPPAWAIRREEFRKKLAEAGLLSTAPTAPPGTIPLSPQELLVYHQARARQMNLWTKIEAHIEHLFCRYKRAGQTVSQ